jgi:hypothetical protein
MSVSANTATGCFPAESVERPIFRILQPLYRLPLRRFFSTERFDCDRPCHRHLRVSLAHQDRARMVFLKAVTPERGPQQPRLIVIVEDTCAKDAGG